MIHNRSHSFLGPSPRYSIPTSHPFHQTPEEIISNITDDDDEIEVKIEDENKDGTFVEHLVCIEEEREDEIVSKVGPEDFEILRVIGKGAFGKVFQVRKKGEDCEIGDDYDEGDGIFAMKVMRKDNIIKKNHVDYMKAERDILTKVVHPFIVQLRYSFQVKIYVCLFFSFSGKV